MALLSVVMPVYNARPFLGDAIASIVRQTLTDFEFVILDDASTDGSFEDAKAWAAGDERIRVQRSAARLGMSASANAVVSLARTGIVARMDADDLSHPHRLAREYRAMQDRPDVSLVGTLADAIDGRGRTVKPRDRWRVLRQSSWSPFPHGSIMFRKASFDAVGGYRDIVNEDYDLYLRMAAHGRLLTLPERLYHYRYHDGNATAARRRPGALPPVHRSGGRAGNPHYARGAVRLWSGMRPGVLRELWADRACEPAAARLVMLGWAVWGETHPSSLRWMLRCATAVRDRVSGIWIRDGRSYEWRPAGSPASGDPSPRATSPPAASGPPGPGSSADPTTRSGSPSDPRRAS